MIDFLIVAAYMVSVLGIGIISGLKVRDLKDYSISSAPFSPFVLMAAIFATLVGGGSTMGVSEKVFSSGLVFLLACAGFVVRDLIIAFLLVPKFDKFKGCLTIGDIMAVYYGKVGKIAVGLAGTLQCSVYLSMQLAAIGHLLGYFLGFPYWVGILVGVGIVVIYSSFGGIKAVTITDVVQFSVLVVAIPVTFSIGLDVVGGFYGVFNSVPKELLSLHPVSGDEVRFYSLVLVFTLPYMNPALVQRLLMGRNTQEVRAALVVSALGRIPYYFMVGVLGLIAYVLNPSLMPDMAFPYIVNEVLPVGVKGLAISGVMAVIMSTADSYLHVAGLLLTHDVIKPLMGERLGDQQEFRVARLVTAVIGTIALAAAMNNTNIIELNVLAYAFWLPAIFLPLVSAVLGVCGSVKSFVWSGFFGIFTYLIWKFFLYDITLVDSLLPAVVANASVFFTMYGLRQYRKPTARKQRIRDLGQKAHIMPDRKLTPTDLARSLVNRLTEFSKKRVEMFGAPHGLFVFFSVANFCFIPLIFSHTSGQITPTFIIYLRLFACGLSFILIMKDFWPRSLLRFLPVFWHFTLLVCLPFFAISMCLFSSCAMEWVIDLVLTNFILGLLVDWRTYVGSILFGLLLAIISFLLFGGQTQFDPNLGNFPIMAYATLVSLLVGATFSRNKERALMEKLIAFKALGTTIAHEMRTPLSSIHISASGLKEWVPALVDGYRRAHLAGLAVQAISPLALESIAEAPERMRYICANTLNVIDMILLQLKGDDWQRHFADCSISDCIHTALTEYSFRTGERDLIDIDGVRDFHFHGVSPLVVHILYNLMRNSFSFIESEKKGRINIWTSSSGATQSLHFRDTAKGIRASDLPHIFEHGFSKRNAGSGVGLHYCKKMMEVMGGHIFATAKPGEFTEFILTFPPPPTGKPRQ